MRKRRRLPSACSLDEPFSTSTKLSLTVDAFRTLLEVLKEAADVCPPLKSSVGLILAIGDVFERAGDCTSRAAALALHAARVVNTMYESIGMDPPPLPKSVLLHLVRFEEVLTQVQQVFDSIARQGSLKRITHGRRNKTLLGQLEQELIAAERVFMVGLITSQAVQTATPRALRDSDKSDPSPPLPHAQEIARLHTQVHYLQLSVVFLD
ncbi:hypothetical protein MIND_00411100 [Mycena indigotica]|uniref:Uncharacterized protein n=1 Tax=Mycena indigotica TaxID=2126181 RepID=A0A8H6SWY8_9AGAR|nr:uncharacterized protein MIND_00411100 [Mycena indigotica]KAF7306206.1 hypothetical protein MIND_00411100 [Mycena indigotica]